jgi:DNA-binding XRE family transcriptional regulator
MNLASNAIHLRGILWVNLSTMKYSVNKKVGKGIKKARRELGLTQENLAEKVDMHYTTISRIETGDSNPPVQTIAKIAKALKIPLSDLF